LPPRRPSLSPLHARTCVRVHPPDVCLRLQTLCATIRCRPRRRCSRRCKPCKAGGWGASEPLSEVQAQAQVQAQAWGASAASTSPRYSTPACQAPPGAPGRGQRRPRTLPCPMRRSCRRCGIWASRTTAPGTLGHPLPSLRPLPLSCVIFPPPNHTPPHPSAPCACVTRPPLTPSSRCAPVAPSHGSLPPSHWTVCGHCKRRKATCTRPWNACSRGPEQGCLALPPVR